MNKIKDLLLLPQSVKIRDEIISIIFKDNGKMNELMFCFFSQDNRLNQVASWPMTIIGEKYPELILPYLNKMLSKIEKPVHEAVVRNTIRVLQTLDIPEDLEGIVYEKCFNYLIDQKAKPAIRAFSMTVLSNIAMKYPDLKGELINSIEIYYKLGSKGFQSRAKKELKRLKI